MSGKQPRPSASFHSDAPPSPRGAGLRPSRVARGRSAPQPHLTQGAPSQGGLTTLEAIQKLPLEATPRRQRSGSQGAAPRIYGPHHAEMVVASAVDDEVSNLSFMGGSVSVVSVGTGSVRTGSSRDTSSSEGTSREKAERAEEDGGTEEVEDETDDVPATLINTANYDSRGRCRLHPQIRLRKKKMFGKGWKVLMSACPECCVDELRRVRLEEEKKRKMAAKSRGNGSRTGLDGSQRSGHSQMGLDDRRQRSGHNANARSFSGSARSFGSVHSGAGSSSTVNGCQTGLDGSQRSGHSQMGMDDRSQRSGHNANAQSFSGSARSFGSVHSGAGSSSAELAMGGSGSIAVLPQPAPLQSHSRSRSRDSQRVAPLPLQHLPRSPSQEGRRAPTPLSLRGSLNKRASRVVRATQSDTSTSTASLTESSEQGAVAGDWRPSRAPPGSQSNGRCRSSNRGSRPERPPDAPLEPPQELPPPGTLRVREMRWTDAKGRTGKYSGQVNTKFSPHGTGFMVYDGTGKRKEGTWKNGRHRRSSSDAGEGGSDPPLKSKSRSQSNTADSGQQSRSQSRSTTQSAARQRSKSRSRKPENGAFN